MIKKENILFSQQNSVQDLSTEKIFLKKDYIKKKKKKIIIF